MVKYSNLFSTHSLPTTGMRRAFSKSTELNRKTTSSYPYLSYLERCSTIQDLKEIHAQFIALGLVRYTYITSRLLGSSVIHGKGDMSYAARIFYQIPVPTMFNWNTMIKGHSKSPDPKMGILIYARMRRLQVDPNMHTFPFAIKACAHLFSLSQFHGHVFKFGFDLDVYVTSSLIKNYSELGDVELASQVFDESSSRNVACWTSLVSGFCSHGLVDKGREVFDVMPERNDVSWSAMITGYVQNERNEEAIELFRDMRDCGDVKLNNALLVSVLSACASSGALDVGKWIHSYIDTRRLEYELELGTAFIDFYAKCGLIERAKEVFDKMARKDVMTWSAMIMGLALNGHGHSALEVFSEMLRSRVAPNAVTFLGVLTACNHGGMVHEGRSYFEQMSQVYGISPSIDHYGCLVDLLSRAGRTLEAECLIEFMPMKPDGAMWGSLLNGCMMHGHRELGERAGQHVMELDPQHYGRYIGLANVYASIGRWERAVEVRRVMRERGVTRTPGWSLIEMEGVHHQFLVDDRTHPQWKEILEMLISLQHLEFLRTM